MSEDDSEVKREACFVGFTTITGVQSLVNYFLNWQKLKRDVCWFLRFKCFVMKRVKRDVEVKTGDVTVSELKQAELEIIKHVQSESFAAEIACVQSDKEVLKESKLAALCPVMRE